MWEEEGWRWSAPGTIRDGGAFKGTYFHMVLDNVAGGKGGNKMKTQSKERDGTAWQPDSLKTRVRCTSCNRAFEQLYYTADLPSPKTHWPFPHHLFPHVNDPMIKVPPQFLESGGQIVKKLIILVGTIRAFCKSYNSLFFLRKKKKEITGLYTPQPPLIWLT